MHVGGVSCSSVHVEGSVWGRKERRALDSKADDRESVEDG